MPSVTYCIRFSLLIIGISQATKIPQENDIAKIHINFENTKA